MNTSGPSESSRSIAQKIVVSVCGLLAAAGCSSTRPVTIPPHVNVSPEEVDLSGTERARGVSVGVEVQPHESDSLDRLEVLPGVRVRRVEPSGPAAAAGIQAGDVILSLGDVETNDPDAFAAVLGKTVLEGTAPATGVRAVVRRDTVVFETEITPEPLPVTSEPRELYRVDPVRTRAGYRTGVLEVLGSRRAVAVVAKLFPESPLQDETIQVGDAVLSLDGNALRSAQDLVTRLLDERAPGDEVTLEVMRESEVVEVSLRLWEPERELTKLAILPLFQYTHKEQPSRTEFSLIDLWIVSLFHYRRDQGESEYRFFSLLRFATGRGELTEELPSSEGEP